jgi:FixJ family two-component response regulator
MMPFINGTSLAEEVRCRIPGVPVLFVTGDGDAVQIAEAYTAPILKKPFRQADFAKALCDLLEARGGSARVRG